MIGAVDIGGTKIAVGMVDDKGKVLSRMESPTDPNRYSDSIELIAHMLRRTAQRAGGQITGIGIGSTGPVDPMRGEFGDVDFSGRFSLSRLRSRTTRMRLRSPKPDGARDATGRA